MEKNMIRLNEKAKDPMQKKISIIVPVFNSELYIRQCIQSVLDQTYRNWEMIVIDDGSTDGSIAICREMASLDKRMQLLCQEHKGVSAARNLGLERAEGEYVFFLDSDDMIHPCLLEEFILSAERNKAQLVMCGYRRFREGQAERVLSEMSRRKNEVKWQIGGYTESEEWFHLKYPSQIRMIGGKLILRNCVKETLFDENLIMGEDTLFIYRLICKGIKTAYSTEKWYYYRIYPGNTINNSDVIRDERYSECCRMIRDNEFQKGNIRFALRWETFNTARMEKSFSELKRHRERERCRRLKEKAVSEEKYVLFPKMSWNRKAMFLCCFHCYPVYIVLKRCLVLLWNLADRIVWKW